MILSRFSLPQAKGCFDAEIVLRHLKDNKYTPYVTHQHNIEFGDNKGFYWGHYFETEKEARVDFLARCHKQLESQDQYKEINNV